MRNRRNLLKGTRADSTAACRGVPSQRIVQNEGSKPTAAANKATLAISLN